MVQLLDELDDRIDGAMQRRLHEWRQHLTLLANQLRHAPGRGIYAAKERLGQLGHRLVRSMDTTMAQRRQRLAQIEATLGRPPKQVLERGYSMVHDEREASFATILDLTEGQTIHLQFADGRAAAGDTHWTTWRTKHDRRHDDLR